MELVHRQPGKGVRLPEDDAAGVQVLRRHDALPVLPGPLELPAPEGGVKLVVGVAGHQPHPDLGPLRQKARAQIPALFADHVHQAAVFRLSLCGCNFRVIDPGMAPEDGGLRFGRDGVPGVIPFRFHGMIPFPLIFPGQCTMPASGHGTLIDSGDYPLWTSRDVIPVMAGVLPPHRGGTGRHASDTIAALQRLYHIFPGNAIDWEKGGTIPCPRSI